MSKRSAAALSSALGLTIKHLREIRELSQYDIAKLTGFHRSYIADLERCERNVALHTLSRLAESFNMPAWQLLKLAESRKNRLLAHNLNQTVRKKRKAEA
jgi:transcriptional regulator with XRE-family HTH domain